MKPYKFKQVERPAKMSFWDKAINAIIRPPKISYQGNQLGNSRLCLKSGKLFKRTDRTISFQQQTIDVSVFNPLLPNKPQYFRPENLIIFCHCNASNRLECMQYLDYLPKQYAIAGFDFLGCGNTREVYISLGCRQSQQVELVINLFKKEYKNIVLWGRSMGAVSVLKYGKNLINICDSPFSSLRRLTLESAYKAPKIPNCLICCVFPCIYCKLRIDIQSRAQFDIDELDIIEAVKKMSAQQCLILIVSRSDSLVASDHGRDLINEFKGKKKLFEVDGDHNTRRTKQLIQNIFKCIQEFRETGEVDIIATSDQLRNV